MIWKEPYVTLAELEAHRPKQARIIRSLIRQHKIPAERIPFLTGRPYGVPVQKVKELFPEWDTVHGTNRLPPPPDLEEILEPLLETEINDDHLAQIRRLLLQALTIAS